MVPGAGPAAPDSKRSFMKSLNKREKKPPEKSRPRAVIFDLDGTLADTLESIARAVNSCLRKMERRTFPVDDYRYLVGDGLRALCVRVLRDGRASPHEETVERLEREVKDYYSRHLLDHVSLYDGTLDLLERLRAEGIPLAVCSNKPDKHTRDLVEALIPAGTFGAVLGARDDLPRKPDPASALRVAAILGVEPGRCLFVGDTSVDMKTARNAGMIPVGVLWGFRQRDELEEAGARHIVEEPKKIAALIG